jgi:hypothetical protein
MVGPETVWSVAKWMPTQANIDKGSVNLEVSGFNRVTSLLPVFVIKF